MNRLKKKAIQEFVGICTFLIIIIPCFVGLVHLNAQGIDYVLIWVIVGVPTGLFVYLFENRKLKALDERERDLYQKAIHASYGVFAFYLLGFTVVTFFLLGGQSTVPVWLLPMMLFSGVFLAVTTSSFILFKQCEKEDDELEGGAA